MHAVSEFGHVLLGELGAPKSRVIETFAEVRFKNHAGAANHREVGQATDPSQLES
jgi:hypothetical protein